MSQKPLPDREWLSTAEAARILGVPRHRLYRLIDEGRLPAYKFGRVVRLRRDEVDAWLREA